MGTISQPPPRSSKDGFTPPSTSHLLREETHQPTPSLDMAGSACQRLCVCGCCSHVLTVQAVRTHTHCIDRVCGTRATRSPHCLATCCCRRCCAVSSSFGSLTELRGHENPISSLISHAFIVAIAGVVYHDDVRRCGCHPAAKFEVRSLISPGGY